MRSRSASSPVGSPRAHEMDGHAKKGFRFVFVSAGARAATFGLFDELVARDPARQRTELENRIALVRISLREDVGSSEARLRLRAAESLSQSPSHWAAAPESGLMVGRGRPPGGA